MDYRTIAPLSRRALLRRAAGGFGSLALAGMFADSGFAQTAVADPLAPRPSQFPARAKSVIFLFATGGTSHIDTFDYKPKLYSDKGKTAYGQFIKSPNWGFSPRGQCGMPVAEILPHLGSVVDDLCMINSMHCDSPGHDKATLGAHTGSVSFARPSIGSWVSYALGTENQNLPSFVVIAPAPPYAGAQCWGSDFLPGCHQGTHVIPGPNPIADIRRQVPTEELQQMELEMLRRTNAEHFAQRSADAALEARIRSLETAAGMQREAPEAFDTAGESDETLDLYGIKRGANTGFGWQCLMARRLVERGVRFVELLDVGSSSNWDSHTDMESHRRLAKNIDQPIAALIKDLKRRGMLNDTLIVWTTEFGRTPTNATVDAKGREHHNTVFSSWLAGAGVKPGYIHGASDDLGINVAKDHVHTHDLHATILHLLGFDHEKLTYRYNGRDYRLTDVSGNVVQAILA